MAPKSDGRKGRDVRLAMKGFCRILITGEIG
jgi:hypothetical protein